MAASLSKQRTIGKIGNYVLLVVASVLMFAPLYYLFIGSLKPTEKVLNGFAGFLPSDLTFKNYIGVFSSLSSDATGYFAQYFFNSIWISLVVVLGGLVINSMAGYAFARLEWFGRDKIFILVILLVIVPFESVAVPLMAIMSGMRDTLLVQMLPFLANAMSIFLFYTFFLNLPKSVEEAATLDGLGPWGTYFRIIVPNAKPVFATVSILTFLSSWGNFLWPALMITDPGTRPLPLEMTVFSAQTPPDWGLVFAFGVLLVLPVLIVFLVFQRFFIQSVAGSAVKG